MLDDFEIPTKRKDNLNLIDSPVNRSLLTNFDFARGLVFHQAALAAQSRCAYNHLTRTKDDPRKL